MLHTAPRVVGGMLNQLCHEWKLDKAKITEYVENNTSLWNQLTPENWKEIAVLADVLGDLDFITPELVIESIKKDFYQIASLLVNWPEASAWLERQITELKQGIVSTDIDNKDT